MTSFLVGEGHHFRPATLEEKNYSIDAVVDYINTAQSSVSSVVADANIQTITAEHSDPYYDIALRGNADGVVVSTTGSAGVLSGNRLSRVHNGTCSVHARHPLISRVKNVSMDRLNDNIYDELISYVSGSLSRHVVDSMTTLVGGKTVADKPVYTAQDHATPLYLRNSESWVSTLDLTAISPWNSRGGANRAGTAITPRHVLLAEHYPLSTTDTIRFVAADNTVVTRTVSGSVTVSTSGADTRVLLLDSDLPASITPLKFLPDNLYDYLPSIQIWPVPVIAFDAQENAITKSTNPIRWTPSSIGGEFVNAINEPFSRLTEPIVTGDSGNPILLAINGEAALLSHWSAPTLGPVYHKLLTEIATALTTLGGGHSLSTVDLSSFTDYS